MGSEKQETESGGVFGLLSLLASGGITVTAEGYPLLSVDSGARELAIEVQGAKQVGLKLSEMIKLAEPGPHVLTESESLAKELSRLGWKLTLYDKGNRVATLGSGVSRLTGHVSLNPLHLKGLLDSLK